MKSLFTHVVSVPLRLALITFCVSTIVSCSVWETDDFGFIDGQLESPEVTTGMRPIYGAADAYDIYNDVTRAIEQNIASIEDNGLLFILDADRGVHILNNSSPSNPQPITFVRVLGIRTLSIQDNLMYVNNFEDFITIDFTDVMNIRVVDRQPDFFQSMSVVPPAYNGFFECYDSGRGPLQGWETASIRNPRCHVP